MNKILSIAPSVYSKQNFRIKALLCTLTLAGLSSTAQATLLFQDSNDYADDAALRAVYKSNTTLSTDTEFKYTASGLSFAGHFASSGGAQQSVTNRRSITSMDNTIQMTGAYNESEWKGQSFTFYSSYLLTASSIPSWGSGSNGATLLTSNSDQTGFGFGIGQTDPDSDDFSSSIAVGDRVDANNWNNGSARTFQGTSTIQAGTTYLILARFDYTNMNEATYNPYVSSGSLRARYSLFTEADGYPISEAGISWEIDQTLSNQPAGEDLILAYAGFSANNNGEGNYIFDELRVGTEFDEVINVIPEPNTAILIMLSLGGFAMFRSRRLR
ncbi:PEP-CTERM sorting domain-containing protein [Kiritimatiellaeota bacterium B1221]|nr:PEP-CTERM sorting domain-containing protein [Kiritimatiellaeota bacterium B1221]